MTIVMEQFRILSLDELRLFVSGTSSYGFKANNKAEAYSWLQALCVELKYIKLTKPDKGLVRIFASRVTGYSRAQTARLIAQYVATGTICLDPPNSRNQFARRYSAEDVKCLVEIDNAHDRLSGKAVRKLMQRALVVFGDRRYDRLAGISVSHIYNLRSSRSYINQSRTFTRTQSSLVAIGERRKPMPYGRPGYIRVDSVHQGDKDKEKGVYHINLIDEVTQWEIIVSVEQITERYMLPAIEASLQSFPFEIMNFHSDNGSEYINKKIAQLLETMRIKLTKSRAYHSGDNGLNETKNGSIIRKALGYAHIPREHAPKINVWYEQWFVPYLNFHRPCGYRTTDVNPKTGRMKHSYPIEGYMTPYEKLSSLNNSTQYLKPGISFERLDILAYAMSDTDWAIAMNKAKYQLLKQI
jgi:transposase InsO family protein